MISAPDLEPLFRALANPTRLAVIERLGRGAASVSELAEPFGMALPSFLQHLAVLEEAGLVRSAKEGRVRTFRLEAGPLRVAETWLAAQRAMWERRLDQLDDYLRTMNGEDGT